MVNIFCSYASSDSPLVLRTYNDLARARETILWCYQLDGRPGHDFREQYLQSIRKADFFLLFDSPAARVSPFVQEEIAEWLQLGKMNPILSCLAVTPGEWRDKNQLFKSQNQLVFIDLTKYSQGINQLHQYLGTTYIPSFTRPRDQEFVDELTSHARLIGADVYRQSLHYYQIFENNRAINPDTALAHLEVMIREIDKSASLSVCAALLTLGDDYFVLNRFDSAIRVFRQVCDDHPKDPRGWAGVGFTHMKKNNFIDAANSFQVSLIAIDESENAVFHQQRLEIVNVLCGALILTKKYKDAWNLIYKEFMCDRANAVTYGYGARLLVMTGQVKDACRLLEESVKRIHLGEHLDPAELTDLIDVARQLGDQEALTVFSNKAVRMYPDNPRLLRDAATAEGDLGNEETAIDYLEQAAILDHENLKIGVELGFLLKKNNQQEKAELILERVLQHSNASCENAYYSGWAHHLMGRRECAEYFLRLARHDENILAWPDYTVTDV